MTDIREAPYQSDARAKGWRFELDMERARQSDTWALAKPEVRPWLLMLWAVAWEQMPCGSLPDDDELIAARIDMPIKLFQKHKAILLRRWWKATDGRLYHDVLVQRVTEMIDRKRSESERKAAWRARKDAERAAATALAARTDASVPDMSRGTDAGQTCQSHGTDNTGTGTGTGLNTVSEPTVPHPPGKKPAGPKTPSVPCPFDALVDAYHQALPNLPRVRLRDGPTWEDRKKAMREVWAWVLSSRKSDGSPRASTGDQALDWFRSYFERAAENDWLMGRTSKSEEHRNWRCDIDFLLSKKGMKAVIEKTLEAA